MSQPSTVDVVTPFDPTGYTSISGAQLEQFGSGIVPYLDKGLIMMTEDVAGVPQVPNANTTTKWQNYMWLRQSATTSTAYIWAINGATDPTYLNWITLAQAGIGTGTITGTMIAINTITDSNIASVNYSKISGAPTSLPPSGTAGGDLTGTYPDPVIGIGVVTAAKIANTTITGAQIAASAVANTNIAPSGSGNAILQTNSGATAVVWTVPGTIFSIADGSSGDKGKDIQWDGTAWAKSAGALAPVNLPGAGSTFSIAHGLGYKPLYYRVVLLCIANDTATAWQAGDEIDIAGVFTYGGGGTAEPTFNSYADATNINFIQNAANSGFIQLLKKGNGNTTQVTSNANFQLKVYV